MRTVILAALVVGLLSASGVQGVDAQESHVLVVSGLGGAPEYTERFRDWGRGVVRAARDAGVGSVAWLAEREDLDPAVTGVARKEAVAEAVAALAGKVDAADLVVLVLFGHGSARDGEARLNLPGPDLSAGTLAAWLGPLPAAVVVVNAASASGGFLPPLSGDGRVVITATRSERETQATRFGGHFVDALAGAAADTDKDGRVSFLEAFEYARREVAREFAASNALPTEHPLLDGDGDGAGSLEPGPAEGRLAARLSLAGRIAAGAGVGTAASGVAGAPGAGDAGGAAEVGGAADTAVADPVLARLLNEKAGLEEELAALRARADRLPESEYRDRLDRLLLDIARNGRAIREHRDGGGGGGGDG